MPLVMFIVPLKTIAFLRKSCLHKAFTSTECSRLLFLRLHVLIHQTLPASSEEPSMELMLRDGHSSPDILLIKSSDFVLSCFSYHVNRR